MRLTTCHHRARFQRGVAARHGALISRSFEAMKSTPISPSDFPDHRLFACVFIAKNLTPLSRCPVAPATILTGRVDFLEKLRNARTPGEREMQECASTRSYWARIKAISELRDFLVKTDAEMLL